MRTKIIRIAETDSTNRYLCDLESKDNTDMTVVVTEFQRAGKGQGGNSWESERGKNLLFSVLVHPCGVEASRQFIISMAVSNAIRRTLAAETTEKVSIKWPNDIYVGDRKICGILIENRLAGSRIKDCIIGIGINVNQTQFLSDAPNPVSLKMIDGRERDKEILLQSVLDNIAAETEALNSHAADREATESEYKKHLYRRDGYHLYSDSCGEFEARIHGIEPDGHLLLADKGGNIRRYAFKEVRII